MGGSTERLDYCEINADSRTTIGSERVMLRVTTIIKCVSFSHSSQSY